MELKELMSTSVESLADKQHEKLKDHVIKILNEVKFAIETEDYEQIQELTFSSPAGDGYGLDNSCINFDYGNPNQYYEGMLDIAGAVEELQNLKEKSQ